MNDGVLCVSALHELPLTPNRSEGLCCIRFCGKRGGVHSLIICPFFIRKSSTGLQRRDKYHWFQWDAISAEYDSLDLAARRKI